MVFLNSQPIHEGKAQEQVPQAEPPEGYLPHQAQFSEHLDTIRELTSRAIPYKSTEWWHFYLCYIAGRQDAVRESREGLQSQINADLKNRVSL